MLPTQYPVKRMAPVSCFLVDPAILEDIMVRDKLNPRPWK